MEMSRRKLKLKVRPKLPAKIIPGVGLAVMREGLVTNIGLDFTTLNPTNDVIGKRTIVFDPVTGGYFYAPPPSGYNGTSGTALTIATGTQTFLTQEGMAYRPGQRVRLVSRANPSNYMEGDIASYDVFTMVVSVTLLGPTSSGTFSDWNIVVAGNPGNGNMLSSVYDPTGKATDAFDSANQKYLQSGAGAVVQSVRTRLQREMYVEDFGAVGDGTADDTAAIQAAINAVPAGGILSFLGRNYKTTTALSVSSPINLIGRTQYATSILCVGCSGLVINSVNSVQIKNLEFAAAVRHTVTANTYTGITVLGSTGARPTNHIYRDVYLDGFKTGLQSNWLWSSVFDNFRVGYCHDALHAVGLSVNNVVTKCSFGGDGSGNGLYLDGGTTASEGWIVSDTTIDNFAIGVYGIGYAHVYINNCIIDHNYVNGVRIDSSATDFGANWTIRGNYIAMTGASGDAAIKSINAIASSSNQGNIIADNQLLAYSGSTCVHGIWMSGSQAFNNVVKGNTVKNFTVSDIQNSVGPDIVTDNMCLSAISANLNIIGNSIVHNNVGTIVFAEFAQYITLGQNKVTWSYNIPTTGTWTQGDICWKSNISAGGIPGWVCVAGGTPGTWKAMAAVAV